MTATTEVRETATEDKEQRYYSPEEYLELETAAEYKSEYYDGKIIPMAGATPNHNRIAGNFYAALNFALKEQAYDVFMTDLRLWIPQKRVYTYPDVMVVAGQLELAPGRKDAITNPCCIAEVLSDSTQGYDRIEKFKFYRTLASFQEYIIIAQSEMHVEQFSKNADNKWVLSEYDDENAELVLTSVPFKIYLRDIYARVEFESSASE